MATRKIYFLLGINFLISFGLFSQNETQYKVVGKKRITEAGTVKLRWAANSPISWRLANEYGYIVEKYHIYRGEEFVTKSDPEILTGKPFKPSPLVEWEYPSEIDDYTAIMAQSIYGETFSTSTDEGPMSILNKVSELQNRYSYAMFSADQSSKAAELAGLYIEDKDVKPYNWYLYKIYTLVPTSLQSIDTAKILVRMEDYQPLPKPVDPNLEFDDHSCVISWNSSYLKDFYNAYSIERSTDNAQFMKINEQPLVYTNDVDKYGGRMFFVDSLSSNDQIYFYRVQGINSFGETGPYSEVLKGNGVPSFYYSPVIIEHEYEKTGIKLTWTFPDEGSTLVSKFQLLRQNPNTKKMQMVIESIDPKFRSAVDLYPNNSNYYIMRAVDFMDRSTYSLPWLAVTEDSIPPNKPKNIERFIAKNGLVSIKWSKNEEDDMLGYKVFRSNFIESEFIDISGPIFEENYFTDTIEINTLKEDIFYKVQAIDNHFNKSEHSKIIKLNRPDIIPPTSPLITSISHLREGILLEFVPSFSDDVVSHDIYRKEKGISGWRKLDNAEIDKSDTEKYYWIDKSVESGTTYQYTVIAVDDASLESPPSQPAQMVWHKEDGKNKDIEHSINYERKRIYLKWKIVEPANQFLIYKKLGEGSLKHYKTISGNLNYFEDRFSPRDQHIEFMIVGVSSSGHYGTSYSTKIKIN